MGRSFTQLYYIEVDWLCLEGDIGHCNVVEMGPSSTVVSCVCGVLWRPQQEITLLRDLLLCIYGWSAPKRLGIGTIGKERWMYDD